MKLRTVSLIILLCLVFERHSNAQNYWVQFTDKKGVFLDTSSFTTKAIERRLRHGILFDTTDFPVKEDYLSAIEGHGAFVHNKSRWINAAYADFSEADSMAISNLPFVKKVFQIKSCYNVTQASDEPLPESDLYHIQNQLYHMGGQNFIDAELRGKGVRIAIFDVGFPDVNTHPAFKHIRDNNKIIETYDFVKDEKNVYKSNAHGTEVLSNIGGFYNDFPLGLAPEAEFLLARTEKFLFEPYSEEKNWLLAAEWADRMGAQIISSSLGYGHHRYFEEEMDGSTPMVSEAARIATRKGILVVNAAGNEGDKKWETIISPADVDSVLTIGGIDPKTDIHINFGSLGPANASLQKPDVSAYAWNFVATKKGKYVKKYGTSYATPLVAGFAACVMQQNPDWTNMEVFKQIAKSGHLYPYYDYAHGYGIPQSRYFTEDQEPPIPTIDLEENEHGIMIKISENQTRNRKTNRLLGDNHLYYHIENNDGYLSKYKVYEVKEGQKILIPKKELENMKKVMVHFRGYSTNFQL